MAFNKMLVAIAVAVSANFFVAEAFAQRPEAPPPTRQTLEAEKSVEGQVQKVDPSGTEITLTDGTTLMTPQGAAIRPGVLEGFTVVASYREENGRKVLTYIALKQPAVSPPPTPRSPAQTAPSRESPPR